MPLSLKCLQHITDTLAAALATCGRRNLRITLDAITTAIETVGRMHAQQQPAAIQQMMVPLFQRWQQPGLTEQVSEECETGCTHVHCRDDMRVNHLWSESSRNV